MQFAAVFLRGQLPVKVSKYINLKSLVWTGTLHCYFLCEINAAAFIGYFVVDFMRVSVCSFVLHLHLLVESKTSMKKTFPSV